jgi:polyisoprenoid-binding protein YceI
MFRILDKLFAGVRPACFALLALVLTSNVFAASSVTFDPAKGSVKFVAVGHPRAVQIEGKSSGFSGTLAIASEGKSNKASGDLTFDLDSLTTGISMRDHHMKEKYLETGKFKSAKLSFKDLLVPAELLSSEKGKDKASVKDMAFKGTLNLHGVDKEITGKADVAQDGTKITVNATFTIKLSDFKIDIPTYLGITVADEVNITATSDATLK